MAVKRRGLGRGLDVLLGMANTLDDDSEVEGNLCLLAVDQLVRSPYQPRLSIRQDSLQALADSIRTQGVVQPLVVRPLAAERYEIVAGERRWRAAQLAGLSKVPALVRQLPDQAALVIALIENIQREDLNPLEEAEALKRLVNEFNLTHQEAAEAIGRSRATVSNSLRLLELCEEVRQLLREYRLEMGHARALLPLPPALQQEAARQIQLRGLSVRETEALVRRLLESTPDASPPMLDPDIRLLQEDLSERLGARVLVHHQTSGKGRLVIHYNSLDELDGILRHVRQTTID
ncbi:MAG: ParB/RepB/Spo0J family partition protein [Gammaproteobacteria bacterium]|nr:ParB/RepB/Spo0J family partition protein [Gammaproteobacteria bacterium]MCP5424622.1 ParB/RepB/Spo0J family partition protein [Gammaproteobacteria bacterium]MCP5460055.1 ParB/RepB/Spo0J family partition protein [Gammaproteobacteria bacterium]